tara:strand:+ start:5693 stop:6979 length:1287 start_codon:yes stop_codon:yes gene_type:complete
MRFNPVQIRINNENEFINKVIYFSNAYKESALYFTNRINKNNLPKYYYEYDFIFAFKSKKSIKASQNSLTKLNKFIANNPFWKFGFLSYNLKNEVENLSSRNCNSFNVPNMFFFVPSFIIFKKNNKIFFDSEDSKIDHNKIIDEICSIKLHKPKYFDLNFLCSNKKSRYLKKIKKIQDCIKRGEVYELNYCMEFKIKKEICAEDFFLLTNNKCEAPFSCFFKFENLKILSFSPERYLKKINNKLVSQPIKGTIKKSKVFSENLNLINTLEKSEKDISENIMITDLVRNDLSITAKRNTVKVEELCKVFSFKNINQMISTITSEIDQNFLIDKIISSTFPMGSMTGAPKIRSMQLIDKFEDFNRGIYSGSIGYVDPHNNFDFNVLIRTIIYNFKNHNLSFSVGSAITSDSDASSEYDECIEKLKSVFVF